MYSKLCASVTSMEMFFALISYAIMDITKLTDHCIRYTCSAVHYENMQISNDPITWLPINTKVL